jgi:hypothetical protein
LDELSAKYRTKKLQFYTVPTTSNLVRAFDDPSTNHLREVIRNADASAERPPIPVIAFRPNKKKFATHVFGNLTSLSNGRVLSSPFARCAASESRQFDVTNVGSFLDDVLGGSAKMTPLETAPSL